MWPLPHSPAEQCPCLVFCAVSQGLLVLGDKPLLRSCLPFLGGVSPTCQQQHQGLVPAISTPPTCLPGGTQGLTHSSPPSLRSSSW